MDREQALAYALSECNLLGADEQNARDHGFFLERIGAKYIKGRPVFEIGCGEYGGFAEVAIRLGATSYKGTDISPYAIEASQKLNKNPLCTFHNEDPRAMISSLTEPHIIVSSSVLDPMVISPCTTYADDLIKVIAGHLIPDTATIHLGICIPDFEELFQKHGLIRIQERTPSLIYAYKKDGAQ